MLCGILGKKKQAIKLHFQDAGFRPVSERRSDDCHPNPFNSTKRRQKLPKQKAFHQVSPFVIRPYN